LNETSGRCQCKIAGQIFSSDNKCVCNAKGNMVLNTAGDACDCKPKYVKNPKNPSVCVLCTDATINGLAIDTANVGQCTCADSASWDTT